MSEVLRGITNKNLATNGYQELPGVLFYNGVVLQEPLTQALVRQIRQCIRVHRA